MAKFVLLEVDDDASVDKVTALFTKTKRVRVAGIFARPVKWCACPHPTGYHKGQVARGGRLGLWVCVVCKRPRMGTHSPFNLLSPAEMRKGDRDITLRVDSINIFEVPTANLGGDDADISATAQLR